MDAPRLTFFCELEPESLRALFADGTVFETLRRLRAGVSLGLLDLSPVRADVVRALDDAGVPVTAWLLLEREQGYFQHLDNVEAATARFEALCEWTARERLGWEALGLDIEQDRRDLERFGEKPWRAVPVTLRRAFDGARLRRGLDAYRALATRMRTLGWTVETYQFPSLQDDRLTGSTLLQRAFGMMDLAVDREVWMLYSSLLPPRGPGWLCSYGPQAQAIAVGSTGGGIDPLPKLTWEELRRDLLLARRWTDALYVFSLEGCVWNGHLDRLASLDWSAEAAVDPGPGRRVDRVRRAYRAAVRAALRIEQSVRTLTSRERR